MAADPLAAFDAEIRRFLERGGVAPELVQLTTPPQREFGERATNVSFQLARQWRRAPKQIAVELAETFEPGQSQFVERVEAAGNGFLNVHLNYSAFIPDVLRAVEDGRDLYGRRDGAPCRHLVVEHTSVNPNKEWHIGHVRNAVLGDVVARTLRLAGNEVQVQNYIDDTGLQAAMAVVGLLDFPEHERPGEKFDHQSGRSYVKIAAELGAEKQLKARLEQLERDPTQSRPGQVDELTQVRARLENVQRLQARVMQVMHGLEKGEHADIIRAILDAQLLTAYRLGIFYNLLAWESNLVESHLFADAMQRLQESAVVFRAAQGRYAGALVIQTGEASGAEEAKAEVLVRSNGLPTYVGKDIAYHMWKFHLVPNRLGYVPYTVEPDGETLWSTSLQGEIREEKAPDGIINIIGVEQSQAQATVKEALRVAGFPNDADHLFHLAYGLVTSPEGKLSGRKGTALSGDDVIDEAVAVALSRVQEKRSQNLTDEEMRDIAEAVGVGAVRYFMVQYNPLRDIVFRVEDVVSYDGNTGLYVQYALVRMHAIFRRAREDRGISAEEIAGGSPELLRHEQEKRLVYQMALYPGIIADATRTLGVNLVAEFAFDLATIFNQFYRDCTVLDADPDLRAARLRLVRAARDVLSSACGVLGVPVIERL